MEGDADREWPRPAYREARDGQSTGSRVLQARAQSASSFAQARWKNSRIPKSNQEAFVLTVSPRTS
jgi:hypothetical protein